MESLRIELVAPAAHRTISVPLGERQTRALLRGEQTAEAASMAERTRLFHAWGSGIRGAFPADIVLSKV